MNTSNAALIAANGIFGVNHLVGLTIFVEGKEITHYKHFNLSQSSDTHHVFQLVLDHDVLTTPQNHDMEEARDMLGKVSWLHFVTEIWQTEWDLRETLSELLPK